jgi:signal transduction histidine kinase
MEMRAQTMNLGQDMHELSQPLTRLQWRLELAKLTGDDAELRDTLTAALEDVGELIDRVRQMRANAENQPGQETDEQQQFTGRVA